MENILLENGIDIPRLRNYMSMADEKPHDISGIEKLFTLISVDDAVESGFNMHPTYYKINRRICRLRKIIYDSKNNVIRWDRIHGRRKKVLKYILKRNLRAVRKQYDMFNKYCGRKDVIYVDCRCGGANWRAYGNEIKAQPGYLEHCFDSFDSTYCDVYFKIGEV